MNKYLTLSVLVALSLMTVSVSTLSPIYNLAYPISIGQHYGTLISFGKFQR
jgi:hypothetical protein